MVDAAARGNHSKRVVIVRVTIEREPAAQPKTADFTVTTTVRQPLPGYRAWPLKRAGRITRAWFEQELAPSYPKGIDQVIGNEGSPYVESVLEHMTKHEKALFSAITSDQNGSPEAGARDWWRNLARQKDLQFLAIELQVCEEMRSFLWELLRRTLGPKSGFLRLPATLDEGHPGFRLSGADEWLALVSSANDGPPGYHGVAENVRRTLKSHPAFRTVPQASKRSELTALHETSAHMSHAPPFLFFGHGELSDEGVLILADENGNATEVSANALRLALVTMESVANQLPLGVLLACRVGGSPPTANETQAGFLQLFRVIVALQLRISFDAAETFLAEFLKRRGEIHSLIDLLVVVGAAEVAIGNRHGIEVERGTMVVFSQEALPVPWPSNRERLRRKLGEIALLLSTRLFTRQPPDAVATRLPVFVPLSGRRAQGVAALLIALILVATVASQVHRLTGVLGAPASPPAVVTPAAALTAVAALPLSTEVFVNGAAREPDAQGVVAIAARPGAPAHLQVIAREGGIRVPPGVARYSWSVRPGDGTLDRIDTASDSLAFWMPEDGAARLITARVVTGNRQSTVVFRLSPTQSGD
jgi:hypothetical protein